MKNTVSSYYNTFDKIMLAKIAVFTTVVAGSFYFFLCKSRSNSSTNNKEIKQKFASSQVDNWVKKKCDWYRISKLPSNKVNDKLKKQLEKTRKRENKEFSKIWDEAVKRYHELSYLDKKSKKEAKEYEELSALIKWEKLRRS